MDARLDVAVVAAAACDEPADTVVVAVDAAVAAAVPDDTDEADVGHAFWKNFRLHPPEQFPLSSHVGGAQYVPHSWVSAKRFSVVSAPVSGSFT